MTEERRHAIRVQIPEGIDATVSGVPVRILDLSSIGARIEHIDRFPLNGPRLSLTWQGSTVTFPVRVARSEIAGRRESSLVYQSGIQFTGSDSMVDGVISSILRHVGSPAAPVAPVAVAARPQPAASAPENVSFDDTWTRRAGSSKDDLDELLPYAQFRLTAAGWVKDYVATATQPEDGFTIPRGDRDFDQLQRTFEFADPETRRMMQIALLSKLGST